MAAARNREFSGSVAGQPQNLVFEGSGLADFLEQLCGFSAVRASAVLPAHRICQCPWQRADPLAGVGRGSPRSRRPQGHAAQAQGPPARRRYGSPRVSMSMRIRSRP